MLLHDYKAIPTNINAFEKILIEAFAGMDDLNTTYYWNTWNDTRSTSVKDFNNFLDAIAREDI